ncbi:MAG: hypothetical protein K2H09_00135, partial [Treponemataceae bacterium]|nr:hypothetical protein [Treponemataceae bacterium]
MKRLLIGLLIAGAALFPAAAQDDSVSDDAAQDAAQIEPSDDVPEEFSADDDNPPELLEDAAATKQKKRKNTRNTIDLPHRYFELGISAAAGLSNNYFAARDCLVRDLVFDLADIADTMPKKGLNLDFNTACLFFMNLNLSNGIHAGFSAGVEGAGLLNIGKGLFDFIGNGNDFNEVIKVDGAVNTDVFAVVSAAAGFDLFGYHLEVMPSVFLPLLHAETDAFSGTFENPEDGSIAARAQADITLYSFTSLEPIFDSTFKTEELLEGIRSGWGFDIYSRLEHKIFNSLQGAVYSRIPIVPGKLNHSMKMGASLSFEAEDMKNLMDNGASPEFNMQDRTYGTANFWHSRPFRIGTQVVWRPFGKWFTVGGLLGLGVRNPYTRSAKCFAEYEFSLDVSLFHILGVNFATSYY